MVVMMAIMAAMIALMMVDGCRGHHRNCRVVSWKVGNKRLAHWKYRCDRGHWIPRRNSRRRHRRCHFECLYCPLPRPLPLPLPRPSLPPPPHCDHLDYQRHFQAVELCVFDLLAYCVVQYRVRARVSGSYCRL